MAQWVPTKTPPLFTHSVRSFNSSLVSGASFPAPVVKQVAVQIAAGVDHLGQAADLIASAAERMQQQHANERAALEAQQPQLSSDYAAKKEQLRQKQLQDDATLRAAQLKLLDPCNQELQGILSSIDHVMQMGGGDPAYFLAHSVYDVRALLKYLQQVQAQVTAFSSVS